MSRRSPRAGRFALVGVACVTAFALTYVLLVHTATGQRLDQRVFMLLYGLVPSGWPVSLLIGLARPIEIVVLAVLVVVLGVVAVARHAWSPLVAALVATGVSLAVSKVLRDTVLTRPHLVPDPFPTNSLPSMHVTAAAALAVAAVLLWPPPRPWWLANAAAVAALLSAVGNVLSQAHRPSDVVASVLLVGAVSGLSLALMRPSWPPPH